MYIIERGSYNSRRLQVILIAVVAIAIVFFVACSGTKPADDANKNSKIPIFNKDAKVGKTVMIEGATYGGKEIAWVVLDMQKDKALLISKYVMDTRAFNDITPDQRAILERGDFIRTTDEFATNWERSSLRRWLNDDFLAGFDEGVMDRISLTEVVNDEKQNAVKSDQVTRDKVFLLSGGESKLYFKKDMKKHLNGIRLMPNGQTESRWWWLRSVGRQSVYIDIIHSDGFLEQSGSTAGVRRGGVRPVIWYSF